MMNIFVDESGTFPATLTPDSWCVVAAYVSPEPDRKAISEALKKLKHRGNKFPQEVKLGALSEGEYFEFLNDLRKLNGVMFAAASDMSMNRTAAIEHHRDTQAAKVVEHLDKMKHESMRVSLAKTSGDIKSLPVNLYAQLVFQISLFHEVIEKSVLYFVQRMPQLLREIRWRVDQKDIRITDYERVFRTILPSILQSISIEKPLTMVHGFDYSYMSEYEYKEGEFPRYLSRDYVIPVTTGLNVGKLVGGNFKFVDSKLEEGVQVVDLLASGLRRLLKCEFQDNEAAAKLLGSLCVQAPTGEVPLMLFTMGEESKMSGRQAGLLRSLQRHARAMLA